MLFKEHGEAHVINAVGDAVAANVSSSEAVAHILRNAITPKDTSALPLSNWQTLPSPDLSMYGQIGGAG